MDLSFEREGSCEIFEDTHMMEDREVVPSVKERKERDENTCCKGREREEVAPAVVVDTKVPGLSTPRHSRLLISLRTRTFFSAGKSNQSEE